MPRGRTINRAIRRDWQRNGSQPNPGHGPNRAARRRHHWRGDIATLVHGPHDKAWLYSGTEHASGQDRINHKRNQRAEYWRTVTVRVSTQMEPYFRATLHLLGRGSRIDGRHPLLDWFVVDLDVHIPGIPDDAVTAVPTYRSVHVEDDRYEARLDSIDWYRADGSRIDAGVLAAAI